MCALFYIDMVNVKINYVLLRLNRCRFLEDTNVVNVNSMCHHPSTWMEQRSFCVKECFLIFV